jgi:DNA polymerase-3 subunit alpha
LSLVNAALRPSGASYRDRLIAKEFNKNPSEQIDELLKDNNGFLVFQEDTIKFLQEICGLSGSEADNIRRAIGRKQKDRLDAALPRILEGYCNKSDKPREVAEKEVQEFLQIIENASSYMFGYNHSTGYSMIGYLCAYYRYYYPLEFITAYLNNAQNEDDINAGTDLIKQKGIQLKPIQFRMSKGKYFFNRSFGLTRFDK